jgi:hypothetical protein
MRVPSGTLKIQKLETGSHRSIPNIINLEFLLKGSELRIHRGVFNLVILNYRSGDSSDRLGHQ